jgi:hypothetical protein
VLLVLQDPSPEELAAKEQGDSYEEKTAPRWVIDRKQFKKDYVGYLDRRRTHISGEVAALLSRPKLPSRVS